MTKQLLCMIGAQSDKGDTKAVAARAALLIAAAMVAGWSMNVLRDQPLPLRYQTPAERIEGAVHQVGIGKIAPPSVDSGLAEEIAIEEFRLFAATGQGWIVDARPAVFHRLGHVPGSLSLPRDDFSSTYESVRREMEKFSHRRVIVYCSGPTCEDSELVGMALLRLGYSNVAIFRGGWSEWTAAGLPEEKDQL